MSTSSEAFCAGLSTALASYEDHPIGQISVAQCLANGLPEGMNIEPSLEHSDAFAAGCALAFVTSFPEEDPLLSDEQLWDMGFHSCFVYYFDPELWLPRDYAVTTSGVCYFGYDVETVPGCRAESGALVTTTTLSFTSGDTSSYLAAIAESAPDSLRLSADTELALLYGQELCTEFTDWGSYEFAKWIVDLEENGAGHELIPDDQWDAARHFLVELPRIVTSHLCPEQAGNWEDSYEFRHEVFDFPDDSAFGGTIGEAVYYSSSQFVKDVWDEVPRESWQLIGKDMCTQLDARASLQSQMVAVTDSVITTIKDELGVELFGTDIDFFGRTVANAALIGYCPRHSAWRWANLDGNYDPMSLP